MKEKEERESDALEAFKKFGGMITDDHFLYTSGLHGTAYVNKDAIYPHTKIVSLLCRVIAERFMGVDIDVVVGPEKGGIILSQWIAYHLSEMFGREVLSIYAEKKEDAFVIKRGYDKIVAGKNVLVVEDVLNTFGTVGKVIETVRRANGYVVAIGALFDRSNPETQKRASFLPRVVSLFSMELRAWDEEECLRTGPCSRGIPINTTLGKGKELNIRKQTA